MRNDNGPKWPTTVASESYNPTLMISKLSVKEKNLLWTHLKSFHPDKARQIAGIMKDPIAKAIIEIFDGSLVVEPQFVPEILAQHIE